MAFFRLRVRQLTPPNSAEALYTSSPNASPTSSEWSHGTGMSPLLSRRGWWRRRSAWRKPMAVALAMIVALMLLSQHSLSTSPTPMHRNAGRHYFQDLLNGFKGLHDDESGDEIPSWWTRSSDDEDHSVTYGTELTHPLAKREVQAPWFTRVWLPSKSIFGQEPNPCADWDPDLPEERDPAGCLRARQYRQVMRVLEREIRAEHPHWYFVRDYNIATFTNISECFLPDDHPRARQCPPRPLIIDGWWYSAEVPLGGTPGETIWQTSVHKQYKHYNVSVALVGPYLNWVEVAEMMPDVYRMVLAPDTQAMSCITDPRCIAKEHYVPPEGSPDLSVGVPDEERGVIPLWALQVHTYWGCTPREVSDSDYYFGQGHDGDWSFHPLGREWIATPWALPSGHVHLPYSIEEFCLPQKFTPHDEREDMVLILAKRSDYFYYPWHSPVSFWTELSSDPAFKLVSTAKIENGKALPAGLTSIGGQSREAYEALVGSAKVMLGIGQPMISPSIYTALCQGTPVVLPVFNMNHKVGGWYDFDGWSQHSPAVLIGEPYVYSYDAQNYTDLETKVHRALNTSIDRYILPDMQWTHCLQQMKKYLNRDLQAMFRRVVRENGGKIPALYKGGRERTYQLDRLEPELQSGRKPSTPYLVKMN